MDNSSSFKLSVVKCWLKEKYYETMTKVTLYSAIKYSNVSWTNVELIS